MVDGRFNDSIGDRNYDKFVETSDGSTAIRTSSIGELLAGFKYDSIVAAYPTTSSETYSYYNGGVSGTLVATITVVYTDATKEVLTSVVRT
jgi:hypothetical protein